MSVLTKKEMQQSSKHVGELNKLVFPTKKVVNIDVDKLVKEVKPIGDELYEYINSDYKLITKTELKVMAIHGYHLVTVSVKDNALRVVFHKTDTPTNEVKQKVIDDLVRQIEAIERKLTELEKSYNEQINTVDLIHKNLGQLHLTMLRIHRGGDIE